MVKTAPVKGSSTYGQRDTKKVSLSLTLNLVLLTSDKEDELGDHCVLCMLLCLTPGPLVVGRCLLDPSNCSREPPPLPFAGSGRPLDGERVANLPPRAAGGGPGQETSAGISVADGMNNVTQQTQQIVPWLQRTFFLQSNPKAASSNNRPGGRFVVTYMNADALQGKCMVEKCKNSTKNCTTVALSWLWHRTSLVPKELSPFLRIKRIRRGVLCTS